MSEKKWPYYILSGSLSLLDAELPEPHVIFLGPLDSILWDHKAIAQLFDFEYLWEVYKPAEQRRWGYYVLPVFYKDRFIARLDSRLENGIWTISHWWWEEGVTVDDELSSALQTAMQKFVYYLGASDINMVNPINRVE